MTHAHEAQADNSTVTVYSKPACVQCNATYKALDKQGIAYDVVDITKDDQARDYVLGLGYQQAPVVVAGTEHWSGFRLDRIKAIGQQSQPGEPTPGKGQPPIASNSAAARAASVASTGRVRPAPSPATTQAAAPASSTPISASRGVGAVQASASRDLGRGR